MYFFLPESLCHLTRVMLLLVTFLKNQLSYFVFSICCACLVSFSVLTWLLWIVFSPSVIPLFLYTTLKAIDSGFLGLFLVVILEITVSKLTVQSEFILLFYPCLRSIEPQNTLSQFPTCMLLCVLSLFLNPKVLLLLFYLNNYLDLSTYFTFYLILYLWPSIWDYFPFV